MSKSSREINSVFQVWKKLSATALSQQWPLRLILGCIPGWVRNGRELSTPYGLPRSVCMISPAAGWRWEVAMANAWGTSSARLWLAMAHPTTAREHSSRTMASYSQPAPVGREVISPT
jgi:hypothetical protein